MTPEPYQEQTLTKEQAKALDEALAKPPAKPPAKRVIIARQPMPRRLRPIDVAVALTLFPR